MPTIASMLDTKSKKEQEKRVAQLIQAAQTPVMAVMVLFDPRSGQLDIRAAGVRDAQVGDIKYVLRQAVDQLTRHEVEAAAQQNPSIVPPDVEPEKDPEEPDGS